MRNTNIISRSFLITLLLFATTTLVISCTSEEDTGLPKKGAFPEVELTNYDGSDFYFKNRHGKVLVVSYIYTNCPDICHMISKKLNRFKSELDEETLNNVEFVSITFDPTRDTPEVLNKHLDEMNLDLENWYFVTGRRDRVYETLSVAGINPIPDEMKSNDSYTLNHRDRISLVDRSGQIRKHYKGSSFNHEELKNDIKTLL